MITNKWLVAGLFMALLTASGTIYAHDGDGDGKDGHGGWGHGEKCHMQLSDAKKQLLHETMKKVHEKDKASIEQMHKLHHQMHDVLAAENFDAHAFTSLSAQIEKVHEKIREDRVRAFASIAGQFTPEEREMLVRMHKHGHHHHHDGHDGEWHHDGHDHAMGGGSAPQTNDNAYPPYSPR